jgi:hypothetical protein
MNKLTIGAITIKDLEKVVELQEAPSDNAWVDAIRTRSHPLSEMQQQQLKWIEQLLSSTSPHLLNEATLWSRCLYPMLTLAEQDAIRAYSEVPIAVAYPAFEINGIIDGVLGQERSGRIHAPYFVVMEAKRGVGAEDPVPQLYTQLLATAQLNYSVQHKPQQEQSSIEVFGAYTIADTWTFTRAVVSQLEQHPSMSVQTSKEFVQRYQAIDILTIMNGIINAQLKPA